MSINQKLLYEKLEAFIIKVTEKNPEMDRNFLLFLRRQQFFDSGNSRLVVENIT